MIWAYEILFFKSKRYSIVDGVILEMGIVEY